MHIAFDPKKSDRNTKLRNLPFTYAAEFDFDGALITTDDRKEYGEIRFIAIGFLHSRLHVLCFTEIEDGIRIISLRRANARESLRYAKAQKTH